MKKSLEKYTKIYEDGNKETLQFSNASQIALDGFKEANWNFTIELFSNLKEIPSIIIEKLSLILGINQKEGILSYEFKKAKNLINAFQPELLQDYQLEEIFIIYNSKDSLRKYKNAETVVDLLSYAFEYKLYRDQLAENKRILPLISKKIQGKILKISKLDKERKAIQLNMKDIKAFLYSERNNSVSSSETSRISKKNYSSSTELRNCNSKTLVNSDDFPDLRLDTEQLYQEDNRKRKNIEISNIAYENEHELKCCRMKYFCF